MAIAASTMASKGITMFLNSRMSDLSSQGRWTRGHQAVAEGLNKIGSYSVQALSAAYVAKKAIDNNNNRAYQHANLYGKTSIKSVGSSEYADVVKRRNNK